MKIEQVENEIHIRCDPRKRSIKVNDTRYFLNFPYVHFKIISYYLEETQHREIYVYFSTTGRRNDMHIPPLPNILKNLQVCLGNNFYYKFNNLPEPKNIKDMANLIVQFFFDSEFEDPYDWEWTEIYASKLHIKIFGIYSIWEKLNKCIPLIPFDNRLNFNFTKEQVDEVHSKIKIP